MREIGPIVEIDCTAEIGHIVETDHETTTKMTIEMTTETITEMMTIEKKIIGISKTRNIRESIEIIMKTSVRIGT